MVEILLVNVFLLVQIKIVMSLVDICSSQYMYMPIFSMQDNFRLKENYCMYFPNTYNNFDNFEFI